jgi:hypothetical protein
MDVGCSIQTAEAFIPPHLSVCGQGRISWYINFQELPSFSAAQSCAGCLKGVFPQRQAGAC